MKMNESLIENYNALQTMLERKGKHITNMLIQVANMKKQLDSHYDAEFIHRLENPTKDLFYNNQNIISYSEALFEEVDRACVPQYPSDFRLSVIPAQDYAGLNVLIKRMIQPSNDLYLLTLEISNLREIYGLHRTYSDIIQVNNQIDLLENGIDDVIETAKKIKEQSDTCIGISKYHESTALAHNEAIFALTLAEINGKPFHVYDSKDVDQLLNIANVRD